VRVVLVTVGTWGIVGGGNTVSEGNTEQWADIAGVGEVVRMVVLMGTKGRMGKEGVFIEGWGGARPG